jgi:folate-binding protein YgfZ
MTTVSDLGDRIAPAAAAALADRGVVAVTGPDAAAFLQGLVTNDVTAMPTATARYAALLAPQGKILFDFLVVPDGGGYLLDCPAALAPDLARRLGVYRLRAKVMIEDRSALLGVVALWGADAATRAAALAPDTPNLAYPDPRHADLGWRVIVGRQAFDELASRSPADDAAYDAWRIACGVPKGGPDFPYGDTFTHEANLDRLHGLDFKKGCYVGQEVVSRIEHRGLARKRIAPVRFDGAAPAVGAAISAGDIGLGVMGSAADGRGLAMVRLDRLAEAAAAGVPIVAAGVALAIDGQP